MALIPEGLGAVLTGNDVEFEMEIWHTGGTAAAAPQLRVWTR